ncbi:MAG TPA: MarR family transcriptional regulator [Acidimicrobiales bacterium]
MPRLTSSLAGQIGHLLRRAHVASLALLPDTGLSERHPSDLAVLAGVDAFGPASQRLLADRLGINPRVMVQIVDRLEREGLVARGRDPADRRSYAVTLTEEGRHIDERLDVAAEAHTLALTRRLTDRQRGRLHQLLTRLLAAPPDELDQLPPALTRRTGFLVARTHFTLRGLVKPRLAPLGIEPQHFGTLAALDDLGAVPQQRVAAELGVSGTMLVQFADHLEAAGLVERHRDPDDRRVQRLTITAAGRDVLAEARRIAGEVTRAYTEPIGAEGAAELRDLLTLVVAGAPGEPGAGDAGLGTGSTVSEDGPAPAPG